MPNRTMAVIIGAFWLVMMGLLVERDVLPQWRASQVDLVAVSKAIDTAEPVRWIVLNGDERIGSADSEWRKNTDGWSEFHSELHLREVPFVSALAGPLLDGGLNWQSSLHVSPDGNLHHFDIQVMLGDSKPWMTVQGKLDGTVMRVQFRSGSFTHDEQFFYEPRSLLSSSLAPFDKLPNLTVGQTWQHRVMNPLMRTTELVRCEVTGEQVITWGGDPVPTYVVEQHYGQFRTRCWVARDGTVLRQEVPLGLNPLVLERE